VGLGKTASFRDLTGSRVRENGSWTDTRRGDRARGRKGTQANVQKGVRRPIDLCPNPRGNGLVEKKKDRRVREGAIRLEGRIGGKRKPCELEKAISWKTECGGESKTDRPCDSEAP